MVSATGLPVVGVEAVIRGLPQYLAGAKQVEGANTRMGVSAGAAATKSTGAATRLIGGFVKAGAAAGIFSAIIGGASVKAAGDFEAAMQQSLAIMGDVSDALRDDMASAARQMAKETTFSATQAAESYFFLASAGLDAQSSIAALPAVAQFAQAGMFDMALATDLLTDAQSALGLTIRNDAVANMENMIRVSDVLVKANTLANATVEQFSTSLTREAGAALKSFNIDIEEGVAVLAAFADQGVKGEVAGTGLSRILRLMTSAAVSNSEAYEELGVRVFDSTGKIRNLADIIADLENALGGMSDAERVAALEALGFQARVQGVILPLLGSSEAIRGYEAELRRAGGTTEEVANKQLQTFQAQMGLLKSRIVDVFIGIGTQLLPAVTKLASEGSDAIDWLDRFITQLGIGKPLLITVGAILGTVVVAGLIAATVAAVAFVASIGAIPLAIAAVIIAVGAASVFIQKNWDDIKAKTQEVWGSLPNIVQDALRFLADHVLARVGAVIRIFEGLYDAVRTTIRLVSDVINGDWQAAWREFKNLAGIAAGLVVDAIVAQFGKLPNLLIGITEKAINAVISGLNAGIAEINNAGLFGLDLNPFDIGAIGRVNLPRLNTSGPDFSALAGLGGLLPHGFGAGEQFGSEDIQELTDRMNAAGDAASDAGDDFYDFGEKAGAAADILADGIITFAEATEAGIDAMTAGSMEAFAFLEAAAFEANEAQFEYAKQMEKVKTLYEENERAARKYVLQLAREALAKTGAAVSAVFGRPTQEVAQLELQLAEINQALASAELRGASDQTIERLQTQAEKIQAQIDLYQANAEVLQKQIQAADQTLLTEEEQRAKALELTEQTAFASEQVRILAQNLGQDLIPEMDDSRRAHEILRGAVENLGDEFRSELDPAARRLGDRLDDAQREARDFSGDLRRAGGDVRTMESRVSGVNGQLSTTRSNLLSFGSALRGATSALSNVGGLATGGIVRRESMVRIGEGNRPEAVLPLTNPSRSQEILASLPPSLLAAITPRGATTIAPSLDVNIDMVQWSQVRRVVHEEVDRGLNQAFNEATRRGGLVNSGIG